MQTSLVQKHSYVGDMFGLGFWSQAEGRPSNTYELSFAFIFIKISSNPGYELIFLFHQLELHNESQTRIMSIHFISRPVKDLNLTKY